MDEFLVTFDIAGEQNEVVITLLSGLDYGTAVKTAAKFQESLVTNDRHYAVFGHYVKKRNRPEHVAVIGNGTRFLSEFGQTLR